MADGQTADISALEGTKISSEASRWDGTPYSLIGELSEMRTGGDCSGSTFKIYASVELRYAYKRAANFPTYAVSSGLFREVGADEAKQDGDVLSWGHHMAIYSSFSSGAENSSATTARTNKQGHGWTQVNDMWTAHFQGGQPFGPAATIYFGLGRPKVFRRLRVY